MPTVERVLEGCLLGEGPHWDISSQSLYLIDIIKKSVLRYVPETKKVTKALLDDTVSFIIPVECKKDHFVISLGNELVIISWDGESEQVSVVKKLASIDTSEEVRMTFNDAKCDSSGRLWTGTHNLIVDDIIKTPPLGSVYSLDSNLQFKSHLDKIHISNGFAFNDRTKTAFYIDTLKGTVDRFDFDITNGTLSNRQVWFTLADFDVTPFPDGMTIDADENLWVAVFSGNSVIKIDGNKPETLLDTVEIPADEVTSVTFGGANLDELYVTSGAIEFRGKNPQPPVHGAVYRVTGLGAKGVPAINFKLD